MIIAIITTVLTSPNIHHHHSSSTLIVIIIVIPLPILSTSSSAWPCTAKLRCVSCGLQQISWCVIWGRKGLEPPSLRLSPCATLSTWWVPQVILVTKTLVSPVLMQGPGLELGYPPEIALSTHSYLAQPHRSTIHTNTNNTDDDDEILMMVKMILMYIWDSDYPTTIIPVNHTVATILRLPPIIVSVVMVHLAQL